MKKLIAKQTRRFVRQATAHWNGRLGSGYIYFTGPLLAIAPLVLILGIALVMNSIEFPFADHFSYLLLWIWVLWSVVIFVWWSRGTLQRAWRLMAWNQLLSPLVLYCSVAALGWHFLTDWIPVEYELVAEASSEMLSRGPLPRTSQDEKKPWEVYAYIEGRRFVAKGSIGYGSAKALGDVLAKHPEIRLLELDSPGGYILEMDQLALLVEKHQLDTLVLERCASACTNVFLAGQRRFISYGSRFGFHQSGYKGKPHTTEWSTDEYSTSIDFRARSVAVDFMNKALNTSYYDIWKPEPIELMKSGYATEWWSNRPPEYR